VNRVIVLTRAEEEEEEQEEFIHDDKSLMGRPREPYRVCAEERRARGRETCSVVVHDTLVLTSKL
jgi:hypothetical protein